MGALPNNCPKAVFFAFSFASFSLLCDKSFCFSGVKPFYVYNNSNRVLLSRIGIPDDIQKQSVSEWHLTVDYFVYCTKISYLKNYYQPFICCGVLQLESTNNFIRLIWYPLYLIPCLRSSETLLVSYFWLYALGTNIFWSISFDFKIMKTIKQNRKWINN